ncbi:histidine kinase-like ATPase, partial [Lactarius psammicola]
MSEEPTPASEAQLEPRPIRRLQESVINRIAAGEVLSVHFYQSVDTRLIVIFPTLRLLHRPASALKELLENCLDAGATSIRITVKDGGMKLLQIQDNGCGIKKSDLPILAHRFTTSKLSRFSDLSHLTTYGFRGEALASISHIANLTVVTKTKKDACAWKAIYVDGEMVPAPKGSSTDPRPCAGNDGTTVTKTCVYNEYARILDVVTKYAVHNAGVSFLCKKVGTSAPDLSTPSSTTKQAVRLLYGQGVAKDLLSVEIYPPRTKKRKRDTDVSEQGTGKSNEDASWLAQAHFTNANYHSKKMVFLLFINNRLVESSRIKKAIEACYTGYTTRPTTVDVNVHPTKREVHFLEEEEITESIADAVQAKLAQSGERTFEYQTLLTGGVASADTGKGKERAYENNAGSDTASSTPPPGPPAAKKILSQHKVRTSGADRTLDSMFLPTPTQSGDHGKPAARRRKTREIQQSTCYLTSVSTLRDNVKKGKHVGVMTEILQKTRLCRRHRPRCELSVVQVSTKLYLVNHGALAAVYQLGLRQFGNFARLNWIRLRR